MAMNVNEIEDLLNSILGKKMVEKVKNTLSTDEKCHFTDKSLFDSYLNELEKKDNEKLHFNDKYWFDKEHGCKCKSDTTNPSTNVYYNGYRAENIGTVEESKGVKLTFAVPGIPKEDLFVSSKGNIIYVKSKNDVPFFGRLDMKVKIKFEIFIKNISTHYSNGLLVINILKETEPQEETNVINID